MPDVVILRGVSGSGKTTFAKRMPRVRISRDDLRRLLFGIEGKAVLTSEQEKKITKFQREWIERELLEGNDVAVDDTNLNKSLLKSLCRFINDIGFNFTFVDTKVSLEEAKARNARREPHDRVPEHVIDRQFKRAWWGSVESQAYVYKPYTPDPSLPVAYSFDLDGTLAHTNGKRGPYDASKYYVDDVDEAIAYVGVALRVATRADELIILTGRDAKYRPECEAWLTKHGIAYDRLIMRPEGDTRNDAVVKSDLWDEHIDGKFNVLMHFDYRRRVVNGLRRKGIKVAQVAPGLVLDKEKHMAINPVKFAEQYKEWETSQQYKDTSPAAYAAELEAVFAVQQVEALKRLGEVEKDNDVFAQGAMKILYAEYGDTWVETYLLPEVPDTSWPESPSEVADDPDYSLD